MRFKTTLFRYPGPGGWTFARIPKRCAPPVTAGWGRTPVRATVDGQSWDTSVWRDRKYGTLLAVPKKIRGKKGDGDSVVVELAPRSGRRGGSPAGGKAAQGMRNRTTDVSFSASRNR